MLKLQVVGDRLAPVIICDFCNEVINSHVEGNFEWNLNEETEHDHACPIYFTHKRCSHPLGHSRGGREHFHWQPLTRLPFLLAHNLKVTREDEKKLRETFPDIYR